MRYRVPHVRFIVRTRTMCLAGRCRAAGARRGDIVAWLCERATLWVVVHVCALLRNNEAPAWDDDDDEAASGSGDGSGEGAVE